MMNTKFDSPALTGQSDSYPASWHGKVPSRVLMDTTVRSDLPWLDSKRLCAVIGQEYDAWVNRHGALCAIFDDGEMLGLKPYEFTVVAWHEAQQSVQPTIATDALEDSPFETGMRRNAVVLSNRNSG